MSESYQLTTDLIVDCIALIPQNLELLNKTLKYEIRLKFIPNRKNFGVKISGDDWEFQVVWILTDENSYKTMPHYAQIIIDRFVKDCLEYIPEFQEPFYNKKYNTLFEIEDWARTKIKNGEDEKTLRKIWNLQTELKLFKSVIASATLHGQGEFPPSTLEELCESYKQVMSK